MNITSPALIALRRVLSTWNGMRRASTPASVSCLSRSLPRLAPVIRLIRSGRSLARMASAWGTALASPARVKTAHADGHAVLDQVGGFGRTHHLVEQGGQAHAITVHGTNLQTTNY